MLGWWGRCSASRAMAQVIPAGRCRASSTGRPGCITPMSRSAATRPRSRPRTVTSSCFWSTITTRSRRAACPTAPPISTSVASIASVLSQPHSGHFRRNSIAKNMLLSVVGAGAATPCLSVLNPAVQSGKHVMAGRTGLTTVEPDSPGSRPGEGTSSTVLNARPSEQFTSQVVHLPRRIRIPFRRPTFCASTQPVCAPGQLSPVLHHAFSPGAVPKPSRQTV